MPSRPASRGRAPLRRALVLTSLGLLSAACSDLATSPDLEAPVGEGRVTGTVVSESPAAGARISGSVRFRARVDPLAASQYRMVWLVDGDRENAMTEVNGAEEAQVDVSGWTWRGEGPYRITFRAYDSRNRRIGETSLDVTVGSTVVTPPLPPPSGSPLSGARFWVDPYSNAKKTADAWRTSRPGDAAFMDVLAARSQAAWFGDWSGDVRAKVDAYVATVVAAGATPVMVAYNLPGRDCGSYSGGGAASGDAYRTWIRALATGLAGRRSVVILEPDGLAQLDCLSATMRAERVALVRDAIGVLAAANALVYVDGGHANWHPAATIAARLIEAGVAGAAGFALNVSNYVATDISVAYGNAVRAVLGAGGFVVDTSRNGLGSNGTWCNAPGRGLGRPATGDTGLANVHAYLYVKRPGESDGTCNGGPAAGAWWAEYALGLAQRASST
jgi:endoglucanase